MTTTVTVVPRKYVDANNFGISEVRTHTDTPSGYGWVNFKGTDVFAEPGKDTWRPGEARLVTSAEKVRLLLDTTHFEDSGGPGLDALGG